MAENRKPSRRTWCVVVGLIALAVMIAALGVWGTSTGWPDVIVAAVMAGLFVYSAVRIIAQARDEYRTSAGHSHPA